MKKIFTVAHYTLLEIYKSKLPVGLILICFFQLVVTLMASEFTYGSTDKISLDFSLGILSLSNQLIAIFLGSTLISKEIESRTLYMILSRPISRPFFILGKSIGLVSIIFVNTVLLFSLGFFLYKTYGGIFHPLLLWASIFSFLESLILLGFATLFSLVTNTTLSILFTLGVLIVGHTYEATVKVAKVFSGNFLASFVDSLSFIMPNLSKLNLKDYVIYKQSMETVYLLNIGLYAILFILCLNLLISLVFSNKDLD